MGIPRILEYVFNNRSMKHQKESLKKIRDFLYLNNSNCRSYINYIDNKICLKYGIYTYELDRDCYIQEDENGTVKIVELESKECQIIQHAPIVESIEIPMES